VQAWEAGLTWVFVQSFVLMAGGFIAPVIRRITPRAALLGSLAGVSITFISLSPANQMFMTPVIGLVCFALILANWFGGVRYWRGVPGGLVAIAVGTVIAWLSTALGLTMAGSAPAPVMARSPIRFSVPLRGRPHVFSGFKSSAIILVTAIPFGIYDLSRRWKKCERPRRRATGSRTTSVLTETAPSSA